MGVLHRDAAPAPASRRPGWGAEPAQVDPLTNATSFLLHRGLAGDTAILEGGQPTTFAGLRADVAALTAALAAHGIPAGSRVGIVGANSSFWVAAYLAAMHAHVAVPFSDKIAVSDVVGQSRKVGCRAVFVHRRHAARLAGVFADDVVVITDAALEAPDEGRHAPLAPPASTDPEADAVLLFTSGTTSAAKTVRLTHRNIVANTGSIVDYLELRPDDRTLVVLPFFYCFGLSLLHTHLRVGGSVSLCNSFVFPEMALDQLERDGCTGFAGVPSTYQLLLRASTFRSRALPGLRLLQQAGGKLSPALVEELVRAVPQARLFVMYGQTEATARLSFLPPELALDKPGSVGRGIPGVELSVLDEHGAEVAPGDVGELYARGANISPGYLDDPDGTAAKFPRGELRTGDLATVDEDGFIYIVDRVDDFIKSWGHRISSQDVEGCVLRIPELVSAAAVGLPDSDAGEAVAVAVTLRPGSSVTADDVMAFARSGLPRHMVPRTVSVLEELPLNANGKVDKRRVRDLLAQTPAAPVRPPRTQEQA